MQQVPKPVNTHVLKLSLTRGFEQSQRIIYLWDCFAFTVEWSTSASFKRILGTAQVIETKNPSYVIKGLTAVSRPQSHVFTTTDNSCKCTDAADTHRN